MMLSVYFGALGVGAVGLGLGLLVQGPLALDRRPRRKKSDSAYVTGSDTLDLHADRQLGSLDGAADEIWRPIASVHFWTISAAVFGLSGLVLSAGRLPENGALGGAIALGLVVGYFAASGLRALPPRPEA